MEEKILIKSQQCAKMLLILFLAISLVLSIIALIPTCIEAAEYDQQCYEKYTEHEEEELHTQRTKNKCEYCKHVDTYSSSFAYIVDESLHSTAFLITLISTFSLSIAIFLGSLSNSLVVTDKRICATAWWGLKQIELPLDSVTSIARGAILKTVCISTPSGTIRFCLVRNNKDIYNTISQLLMLRQSNRITV